MGLIAPILHLSYLTTLLDGFELFVAELVAEVFFCLSHMGRGPKGPFYVLQDYDTNNIYHTLQAVIVAGGGIFCEKIKLG